MATKLKPPPRPSPLGAIQALFREARQLERRRRRRYAAIVVVALCLVVAAASLIPGPGNGSRPAGDGRPVRVGVSSVKLPKAGDYFSLTTVNGHLLVSGGPQGSLFPSGTTALVDGRAQGMCDAATVDPVTLKLGPVKHGNCGDPALYGERIMAISYLAHGLPTGVGTGAFAVRIARADPTARDGYTLGPVVMTYPQCSDCGAEWIYGNGSLWLYDNVTTHTPPGAELLRVSATTGVVLQRWRVPQFIRTLLAVDSDGLWFAPSNESGLPTLHPTAAQRRAYQSLYRVTPGSRPVEVLDIGTALWLVASDHTVWVGARDLSNGLQLWHLRGSSAMPTSLGRYPADSPQGAEFGAGLPTFAGNAAIGIYYVVNENARQQIIRLSPNAATEQSVATINAPGRISQYFSQPPAVALGRSFYFLDPPTLSYNAGNAPPTVGGAAVLYRVTPTRPK